MIKKVKATMKFIEKISKKLGFEIRKYDYKIESSYPPHKKPSGLPQGYSAIYIFVYKDKVLKIGKANAKSSARYCSQHYSVNSCVSNLAKSIVNDKSFNILNLNKDNIKDWMIDNLTRINILIKTQCGKAATELIESIFHYKFRPKYEGNI